MRPLKLRLLARCLLPQAREGQSLDLCMARIRQAKVERQRPVRLASLQKFRQLLVLGRKLLQ